MISPGDTFATFEVPKAQSAMRPNDCNETHKTCGRKKNRDTSNRNVKQPANALQAKGGLVGLATRTWTWLRPNPHRERHVKAGVRVPALGTGSPGGPNTGGISPPFFTAKCTPDAMFPAPVTHQTHGARFDTNRSPPPPSRGTYGRAQVSPGVGKPPHGLGVCIWMPLVNGTGNTPVSGTADPRSSQTGQVIRGLR